MGAWLPRAAFIAAACFLAFLAGFCVAFYKVFPYGFLARAFDQGVAFVASTRNASHHLHPVRHDLVGAVTHHPGDGNAASAPAPGFVLISSHWPEIGWRSGLRLIDRAGRVIHTWNADIAGIWPASAHASRVRQEQRDNLNYIHGAHVFENGDVLFNVDYTGLVRMTAAGDVVWTIDRSTHHSIHLAENGNFWVVEARWVESDAEVARRFPGLSAPVIDDTAIEVSPDGRVLREVSIFDAIGRSEHADLVRNAANHGFLGPFDVLHVNDVEPLPASLASEYPLFEAGDLMVSSRRLSAVFVIDPATLAVKWCLKGTTLHQHDPDFIGDGWISVYDNNSDGTPKGESRGGSRLIAVRPHTGVVRQIYPPAGHDARRERPFYSTVGGKCQLLPGGHWLINEPTGGRVFEIDALGRTIWEWGHQPTEGGTMISEVLDSMVCDLDPALVQQWAGPS